MAKLPFGPDSKVHFLAGYEETLSAQPVKEGTVYFALKPDPLNSSNTIASIYIDAEGKRIKASGDSYAILDALGDKIVSKYIKAIEMHGSAGTKGTLTYIKGDGTDVTIDVPTASANTAGFITTGTQTLSGSKTFNHQLFFKQGSRVWTASGTQGTSGYTKIAQLKISAQYSNTPITIEISSRGRNESSVLNIRFSNVASSDPTLDSFTYTNVNYGCYLHKSAASTWDLYVKKSEGYDTIQVLRVHNSYSQSSIAITWTNIHADTLPEGAKAATLGGSVLHASKADTATKATQDGSGNSIITTYLRDLTKEQTASGFSIWGIKGNNSDGTKITIPGATTSLAGLVTTGNQTFAGIKTLNGFVYGGMTESTANENRALWFMSNVKGTPTYNANFTYNPSTKTLTVTNITGTITKAIADKNGNDIYETYLRDLEGTTSTTVYTIKGVKGNGAYSPTTLTIPAASTTVAGLVTTGSQTFEGLKSFKSFVYSGMGEDSSTAANRNVWFMSGTKGTPVSSPNFTYNPSTQTITAKNYKGLASNATADSMSQNISTTYIKNATNDEHNTEQKTSNIKYTFIKGNNSTFAVTARADHLWSHDIRNRETWTPAHINRGLYLHFGKREIHAEMAKETGTYLGLASWGSWHDTTNFSGGYPFEIAYTQSGNLWTRLGKTSTTWNPWTKILSVANYKAELDGTYVNVTGDTMTGNLTVPNIIVKTKGTIPTIFSATRIAIGTDDANYGLYNAKTTYLADKLTVAALATVDTLKISNTAGTAHIAFTRGSYNYITAPTGGSIIFIPNGGTVGLEASHLTIENTAVRPGTTNVVNLGTTTYRWKGIYGQTLNIASTATISGALNVTGLGTFANGLTVTAGATKLGGTLDVTGKATFASPVELKNELLANGNIRINNANPFIDFQISGKSVGYVQGVAGKLILGGNATTGMTVDLNGNVTVVGGVLHTKGNLNSDDLATGGLHLHNSNIQGINKIVFGDLSDGPGEGIDFVRSSSATDTIWVKNGAIFFTPNRPVGSTTAAAYHITRTSTSDGNVGSVNTPVYVAAGIIKAFTSNIGSNIKPIFMSAGQLTASDGTVGSTTKPIFLNAGTLTASNATVGATTKPIFLNAGTLTASNATVASATSLMYLNAGTLTKSTSSVAGTTQLMYLNAGTLTASTAAVGASNKPVYLTGGKITASTSNIGNTKQFVYMSGGAITATTATIGNANTPVYMANGVLTACTGLNASLGASFVRKDGDTMMGNLTLGEDLQPHEIKILFKNQYRNSVWMGMANGAGYWYIWDSHNNKSIITSPLNGETTFNGHATSDLSLSGGYLTGRVFNSYGGSGQSFIKGTKMCDFYINLVPVEPNNSSAYYGWYGGKTRGGAWSMGTLNTGNDLLFVYGSDSNYNSSNNVTANIRFSSSGAVYGAVWNDYAEYRKTKDNIIPGQCVIEGKFGVMIKSYKRLQAGGNIVSDTFGFAIGETDESKTPIAVSGRVLAYPYEDRYSYPLGAAVCTGPNGTVSLMTREEIKEYPERIVGTVSEIPEYKTWGEGNVPVNGRIWIKVK